VYSIACVAQHLAVGWRQRGVPLRQPRQPAIQLHPPRAPLVQHRRLRCRQSESSSGSAKRTHGKHHRPPRRCSQPNQLPVPQNVAMAGNNRPCECPEVPNPPMQHSCWGQVVAIMPQYGNIEMGGNASGLQPSAADFLQNCCSAGSKHTTCGLVPMHYALHELNISGHQPYLEQRRRSRLYSLAGNAQPAMAWPRRRPCQCSARQARRPTPLATGDTRTRRLRATADPAQPAPAYTATIRLVGQHMVLLLCHEGPT
jgi:hypothetical protein